MTAAIRNLPISLDQTLRATLGPAELQHALRRIVCSVKFELVNEEAAIRLLGPEMSYHLVDPHLAAGLKRIRSDLKIEDIFEYRSSCSRFDLCFEDSWTGYFMARSYERRPVPPAELVLIHLDDHTDMMSTLLSRAGDRLIDPTTDEVFDPKSSNHWQAAIRSGAVNIGNFVTPWCHAGIRLHIRHVDNAAVLGSCFISPAFRSYELIPEREFAALEQGRNPTGSVGMYVAGTDPQHVLRNVPDAWTLVHVDLDYFINDFNGASKGEDYVPPSTLHGQALAKMDRFFDALRASRPCVDRWIIATSPGFCSAHHWHWLLAELDLRIEAFDRYEAMSASATL